jgi:malonate transporter
MVVGYQAARLKLLPGEASEVLSRFDFVIALPSLIFSSLARIGVAEFFNWQYIGALGGGMLITFVIGASARHYRRYHYWPGVFAFGDRAHRN